ncbi:hypothetical protein MKEN_00242500 [Mycena kentingensis (nom. inval.)]|nr:hypothetical protein MKEN_00242500 [Mycena kentingensis (nom. inval.)]
MSHYNQQQPGAHPDMYSDERGGAHQHQQQRPQEDSLAKTVGKKYAGGVASNAGKHTEEYVKENHEELGEKVEEEYDAAKERAQEEFDKAKQTWAKIFPCCG